MSACAYVITFCNRGHPTCELSNAAHRLFSHSPIGQNS